MCLECDVKAGRHIYPYSFRSENDYLMMEWWFYVYIELCPKCNCLVQSVEDMILSENGMDLNSYPDEILPPGLWDPLWDDRYNIMDHVCESEQVSEEQINLESRRRTALWRQRMGRELGNLEKVIKEWKHSMLFAPFWRVKDIQELLEYIETQDGGREIVFGMRDEILGLKPVRIIAVS